MSQPTERVVGNLHEEIQALMTQIRAAQDEQDEKRRKGILIECKERLITIKNLSMKSYVFKNLWEQNLGKKAEDAIRNIEAIEYRGPGR